MVMQKVRLLQHTIEAFGENPECRGCGRILWANEEVYPSSRNEGRTYFCLDCIKKPLLIYPILPMGRTRKKVKNASLFPFARIVDCSPVARCVARPVAHTLSTNICSVAATQRLLGLLLTWYGFDVKKASSQIVTLKERQETLGEQKWLAKPQKRFIDSSMRAFRDMMKRLTRNAMISKTHKIETIRLETKGDYWVQPTIEAFQVLPFRVKTYPWKVLSIHEETIVVEQVSKTGTKYRVTYHKSFMEKVEVVNLRFGRKLDRERLSVG